MSETTCYQRNKDVIIKKAKHYYENDKERLREQARYKYRKLSEEKKRENMEETDIIICLKKKKKTKKTSKNLPRR